MIEPEQAIDYNNKGYGIYWTVNEYNGARRTANLTKINYFFVDIDEGDKKDQLARIQNLLVKPSMIIESKNGYHCYWKINGLCSVDQFKAVEDGLIQKVNADPHCKDPVRLLRAPYFYHQKDLNDRFFIDVIEDNQESYTTEQMLYVYGARLKKIKKVEKPVEKNDFLNENNWERIFKLSSIGKGNRNSMFARYIFWLKDLGLGSSAEYIINGLNRRLIEPLPQYEIDVLLRSKGV